MEVLSSLWKAVSGRHIASCEAPLFDYAARRADPRELRVIFYKYASVEEDGERYMTPQDFVRDYLQMDGACFHEETLKLLSGCVDQTKDGLISFPEFQAFESLLGKPDRKFRLLFQLFDLDGKGTITFEEFKQVVGKLEPSKKIPFDFDCEFMTTYFGKDKKHHITYAEFTQFIKEFQNEYLKQGFFKKPLKDGTITSIHFAEIMKALFSHKLSHYIVEHIASVTSDGGSRRVSYPFCTSFLDLLDNIATFQHVFKELTGDDKFYLLTKEEVLREAVKYRNVNPLHVDILFQVCQLDNPGTGKISLADVNRLIPKYNPLTIFSRIHEIKRFELEEPEEEVRRQSIGMQALESAYRFGLGSIAGAAGATAVYPIDLVKTRMQNQRSVLAGEIMYKNSLDCFFKVIKNEGVLGLYRGLLPQLIGVSPEKAIKLTTNDFVRGKLKDSEGEITLPREIVAGGCGGCAQVMFTNPIEIVKIRMQVAGEVTGTRPSALTIMRELGFTGLYKGARACFLRDIPFSAIYFPCYAHLKIKFADEHGYNNWGSLLAAAAGAGVPAAYLVTPADVIKTRLQVKARRGQQTYRGVIDCFRKVWAEEGGKAFWKGGPARVFRSSPQFGVTLLTYEILQRLLYVDFGGGRPKSELVQPAVSPEISLHPDHIGGYRLAVATYSGIETKFGLFLPKFKPAPVPVKSATVKAEAKPQVT